MASLLEALEARYPEARKLLRDERGVLRSSFRIFVNGEDMRGLDGLETRLRSTDRVDIVPTIQGG